MYDWANSVYSLVISTVIFPIYYETVTKNETGTEVSFLGSQFENTVLYNYIIAASYLAIALLSPYFAAMADRTGRKKVFMRSFMTVGAVACMGMFFFDEGTVHLGLALAFLASIGFSGSIVFYNAFLPVIAPKELHDSLSARGFALGYLGSALLLIISLVLIQFPAVFGFSNEGVATKFTFALTGFWWLGFGLISISKLPKDEVKDYFESKLFRKAWKELFLVLHEFSKMGQLRRFLSAFFWYSTGMQTVILIAGVFGAKVLGMETTQLILVILTIQFVAIIGAYAFAWFSAKTSNITTIIVGVSMWMLLCLAAYFVTENYQFYSVAGLLGFAMGAVQSISRSTYSKMLPKTDDPTTYFSFYDVIEKLAITVGMASVALVEGLTGSLRNSTLALSFFFVLGLIQLTRLSIFQQKTSV